MVCRVLPRYSGSAVYDDEDRDGMGVPHPVSRSECLSAIVDIREYDVPYTQVRRTSAQASPLLIADRRSALHTNISLGCGTVFRFPRAMPLSKEILKSLRCMWLPAF